MIGKICYCFIHWLKRSFLLNCFFNRKLWNKWSQLRLLVVNNTRLFVLFLKYRTKKSSIGFFISVSCSIPNDVIKQKITWFFLISRCVQSVLCLWVTLLTDYFKCESFNSFLFPSLIKSPFISIPHFLPLSPIGVSYSIHFSNPFLFFNVF